MFNLRMSNQGIASMTQRFAINLYRATLVLKDIQDSIAHTRLARIELSK